MIHFTSGDYICLKTDKRQLSIKMYGQSPVDAVAKHRNELEYQIDRMTAQLEFLKPFFSGQSVSDPDALRF